MGTALLEVRLNLLSPSPWLIGLILGVLGYITVRTSTDASAFRLGWALSHELGPLTGLLLLFLAAGYAHRPQRYELTELQDSKIVGSEELIFGRWLGMVAGVLVPLGLQFATVMIGQKIHSQLPVLPEAYAQALLRMLPPVLFLTTLSFCLVTLTRVLVLGAGLAGLLWFVLYAGKAYYGSVFRIELTQNRWVFLGLIASTMALMLLGYRGQRRAKRARATYGLAAVTALAFIVTLIHAGWVSLAIPGKAEAAANARRLRRQDVPGAEPQPAYDQRGPLPNFAWLDQRGRRVSLAGLRGRPALLIFMQPKDDGLIPLLKRAAALPGKFRQDDLQVLGVCFSEDLNGAAQAASLARVDFPIVTDWGPPLGERFDPREPCSVLSWCLKVRRTPTGMLLDEQGQPQLRDLSLTEQGWDELQDRIKAALRGEASQPQVPNPQELLQRVMP